MPATSAPSCWDRGSEFFALRDYRPGDTLRHVNWKASARRDTLVTNEYETERSGDVTIIVDARTIGGDEDLEATVEAATSLSSYFLKQRDRVGMVILGHVVDVIKANYGKRQMQKIVDHLTDARPGAVRSAVSIRLALNRYFRGDSMVVLITALNDRRMVRDRGGVRGTGTSPDRHLPPSDTGRACRRTGRTSWCSAWGRSAGLTHCVSWAGSARSWTGRQASP